jgi:hypothetical protein
MHDEENNISVIRIFSRISLMYFNLVIFHVGHCIIKKMVSMQIDVVLHFLGIDKHIFALHLDVM